MGIWFCITCKKSYSSPKLEGGSESSVAKKRFFLLLGCCYRVWILALPVVSYVALLLDPWVFDIVNQTGNITVTTIGYIIFTIIIWPSHSSKYFDPPERTATIHTSVTDHEYARL